MSQPKYLKDKDPWMLGEDIPDMDFFFSQIWISGFSNEFYRSTGRSYKKAMSIHKGYHLWFYYGEQDSKLVGDHLVKKFFDNPDYVKEINKKIISTSDALRQFAEKLPTKDLDKLSSKQLSAFFKTHDRLHSVYYQWGWMPVAADMFHNNLTEKLKQYLRSIDVTEDRVNEYLMILTQPTTKSLIQIEQEEFLRLAVKIQKDPLHKKLFKKSIVTVKKEIQPSFLKLIKKHHEKYFYVARMWIGEVSPIDHYVKEMIDLIKSDVNADVLLKKEEKEFAKALEARKKLIQKLGIKGVYRKLFDGFGGFMVTKIYRRYAQLYALYKMNFVIEEFAKRMKLSIKEARFMLPPEIQQALLKGSLSRKIIKERTKFCIFYAEKDFEKIYIGKQAKEIAKTAKQKVDDVSELHGQTGCVGKATGIVRIVIRPKDMVKMRKGDILVSIATDPDIVAAMKKAAAIVTEQGGVTSHAAIVSRELNTPCVIGTKIATKVLKDGDKVEVDANLGIVKKL